MKRLYLLFGFFIFFQKLSAQIRLPSIIGDSMVLQQKMNVPIWGWASPGEKVNVTASWSRNITLKTLAGPDGKWMVKLKTPRAGGPYDMVVKGNTTKLLHGILIGEVWICSGQSNMEMPVGGWDNTPINNSKEEIAAANYPDIRLFTVSKKIAIEPEQDVSGSWASSTPGSVSKFSATAYFFGRALAKKLGVPVGLIHTSWGGTVAEAWTSAGALHKLGDFDNELKKLDSIKPHLPELVLKEKEENILWNKALTNKNSEYAQVNFDDKGWKKMNLPGAWENSGYPDLDGIVWFRKLIDIPASWSGKKLKLDLGPVDDYDVTYFNGDEIGSTTKEGSWNLNRNYEIPGRLVHAGPNLITIKVTDLGGGGGLTGDQKLLKLYLDEPSNEESLALAGEWSFNIEAVKPNYVDKNPNVPSVLYNGMIAPLIPYAIKGAIWYQGEANVGRATQYEKLFPAMIADWRSKWKQGPFPFYFVQIAPYKYGGDSTQAAALRDAQRKTLAVAPNTGMVVALDIGDVNNIHPSDKQDIGKRLSLWALAKTYGQQGIVYSGPLYDTIEIKGDHIIVSFKHTEGGLVTKENLLSGFEIAGKEGNWMKAKAVIQGDKIIASSDQVPHPVAVRYNWYAAAEATLFNGKGLPASSFSSEK